MLTAEQIFDYLERVIAEDRLSGNRSGLKNAQVATSFLVAAAKNAHDDESARKFQILGAQAANNRDEP
jgi:hypothetical protein